MPTPTRPARTLRHAALSTSLSSTSLLATGLLCAALAPLPARAADAALSEGFSAGVTVRPLADASEIGLPVYPGATTLRDAGDDAPGAHLALWGGAFGLRLRVMKLRAPDGVDTVAQFYREALARHGRVVDCSAGAPAAAETSPPASGGSALLRCGNDRPQPGGQLFKAGMPGSVRIVAIEPAAGGSQVQLVHLQVKAD